MHPEIEEVQVVQKLLKGQQLRVVAVDVLKDGINGHKIPNQNDLLAYGMPGYVQLQTNIWDEAFRFSRNMDYQIFHELCRAAAPKCNDEAYRISIVKLHLAPTRYLVETASTGYLLCSVSYTKTTGIGGDRSFKFGGWIALDIKKASESQDTLGGGSYQPLKLVDPDQFSGELSVELVPVYGKGLESAELRVDHLENNSGEGGIADGAQIESSFETSVNRVGPGAYPRVVAQVFGFSKSSGRLSGVDFEIKCSYELSTPCPNSELACKKRN
jgi:hypothetical protein